MCCDFVDFWFKLLWFVTGIFGCWCYVLPKMSIMTGFEVVDFGFKLLWI
jgi:hypothetical protein